MLNFDDIEDPNHTCQQNHLNLAFKMFAAYKEKYMPVSRAYFKMRELWFDHLLTDESFRTLLRSEPNGLNVIDIGAAPGGWSQCLKNGDGAAGGEENNDNIAAMTSPRRSACALNACTRHQLAPSSQL